MVVFGLGSVASLMQTEGLCHIYAMRVVRGPMAVVLYIRQPRCDMSTLWLSLSYTMKALNSGATLVSRKSSARFNYASEAEEYEFRCHIHKSY